MRYVVGQRVRILGETRCVAPPPPSLAQQRLAGRTAIVRRLRHKDDAAWVELDGLADAKLGSEILVFPGECQVLN